MTWIRVETTIGKSVEIGRLRSILTLKRHEAIGLVIELFGALAEHETRGTILELPDTLLEDWAGWTGDPGRFADAFRQIYAPAGVVETWKDQQEVLIRRQENDRERKRKQRAREKSGPTPPDLFSTANVDNAPVTPTVPEMSRGQMPESAPTSAGRPAVTERNVTEPTTAVAVGWPTDSAIRLARMLNRGLHDNPAIGERYNPIVSSSGATLEAVEALKATEMPIEFAEGWVYHLASIYKPRKLGDQINSITYLVSAVIEEWDGSRARVDALHAERPQEPRSATAAPSGQTPPRSSQNGTYTLRAGEIINLVRSYKPPAAPESPPDDPADFEEGPGGRLVRVRPRAAWTPPPPAWRAGLTVDESRAVDAIGVDRIRAATDATSGIVLAQLSKAIAEAARGA